MHSLFNNLSLYSVSVLNQNIGCKKNKNKEKTQLCFSDLAYFVTVTVPLIHMNLQFLNIWKCDQDLDLLDNEIIINALLILKGN